jgi:MSHA biogenesis protein MshO
MIKNKGFTLIELVTVMVITGIISMTLVNLITTPMQSYVDMKRRAELVDIAELTLQRMAREIHLALPNSIRVTTDRKRLEILRTIDGGRYAETGENAFTTTQEKTSFGLLKKLRITAERAIGSYVVVYNSGENGADAYASSPSQNRAQITQLTNELISFTAIQFPYASPEARFMVVDQALTFGCTADALYLKQNYPISSSTPSVVTTDALLAKNISACVFDYAAGSSTRPGLVTLQITINDVAYANEQITLLHQIFVENQP